MNILRVAAVATVLSLGAVGARAQAPERVSFGRDIRPLLADRCFRCHGPDGAAREAELRLDLRDAALAPREHGRAIVPGHPADSLLWQRVTASDPDERMPPAASSKPPLSPDELALVERWLAEGAVYEPHWAFVPPVRPELPAGAAPGTNPIDAFLGAAQRRRGIAAAPPADAATLARRAFLVLTGLPPTPDELDAFAADTAPDAFERLVDRLLGAEPYQTRHAEHLAGIWLDAGRYADTSGIHMDAGRQAWLWRDWLVDALRDDRPFDEFVVEQLAGDLLPDATPAQRVATGFLRNHVTTDEGGAIDEEYRVEYAAERTATIGSVFLGLTLGCARCHDHKYDPVTQRDYYRLFSFFNSNDEPGLYSQSKDANRALEPFLEVPTERQQRERAQLVARIATAEAELQVTSPAEQRAFREFVAAAPAALGVAWTRPTVLAARSEGGATLAIGVDGSVLASGENPARDTHTFTLATDAVAQRWLCLEALPDPSLPDGKVGRAPNGNVVLQHVRLEVRPAAGGEWTPVPLGFALADVEQQNGDFCVGNVLDDDDRGWAIAAHQQPPGPRTALLLADAPFGFPGGSELRVTLAYDSGYAQHVFGRVRFALSAANAAGLERLPLAVSGLHVVGPFDAAGAASLYDLDFGPERATSLRTSDAWAEQRWRFDERLAGAGPHALAGGRNVHYVAQRLWAPDARTVEVALGSDDGFQLYLDGQRVFENRVDRAVDRDQDRVRVTLTPGAHLLVQKVVNTGGAGGFALRHAARDGEWHHDLCLAVLPGAVDDAARGDRIAAAYRTHHSPERQTRDAALAALRKELEQLDSAVPRAMVMHEAAMPRPTFVLTRGEYDKPDPNRPVTRELPEMFGPLPDGLPKNRLGLARWLVSEQDPLFARVAVNRLWEFVFGTGIVRTSEDFGRQGEWPSHPELLDWLATEFREQRYSVRAMLRLMVTSAAFRRSNRVGDGVHVDPDDRLLSWFPRRRLTAEAIRDQALYVAGQLVERVGGPSVKPYQPPGLWREVAMVQSNTRVFERGDGEALWRRSLYTYWKRACPPPSLSTFDAPTREFCTIRRSRTNTPLQALVLWNDEQFVEAARLLAQRTLRETRDERLRVAAMYRRTTGETLAAGQLALALATLREQERRYRAEPDAAKALLGVGTAPRADDLEPAELAAYTLLASAFLDLDATVYVD